MIEKSTAMVLRSMVANEMARIFYSESISIEVKKSEGRSLHRMQMKTLEGGILQTPSGRGVFGGNGTNTTNAVSSKVRPQLFYFAKPAVTLKL